MSNPAFITGSYAYGTPHPKSDVDLVVFCNSETSQRLYDLFPVHNPSHNPSVDESVRCGKLNIIQVTTQAEYDHWWQGTQELIARKPVTRDEAIQHFAKLRRQTQRKRLKKLQWSKADNAKLKRGY